MAVERLKGTRLGVIGAGNMAEALCRALLRAGLFAPESILASDISPARRELFQTQLGIAAVADNKEVVGRSEVLLLAVKPQQMNAVLDEVGPLFTGSSLIISIAAGVRTRRIESAAPGAVRVVRVMPNTPMLIGAGMAALCKGKYATDDDLEVAAEIFRSAGQVVFVEEDMMDAVTAVSGSGPAYVFYLVEAMIEAGMAEGLPAQVAAQLAKQTAFGAGKLLVESADTPEELRRKVTSPGGTTEAAIRGMNENAVRASIVRAVRAAAARSRELAKEK